jgi:hypothetical protein
MFGSVVLEIAVGLTFVYLLLSIVCSAIGEFLSGILSVRAKMLHTWLEENLADSTLTSRLYAHKLFLGLADTSGLFGGRRRLPSYVPARVFALALFDVLRLPASAATTAQEVRDAVSKVDPKVMSQETKDALSAVLAQATGGVADASTRIESWFDDSMERLSGWYKMRAHTVVLAVALVVTALTNADTLMILSKLSSDASARAMVAAAAEGYLRHRAPTPEPSDPGPPTNEEARPPGNQAADTLASLPFDLGWSDGGDAASTDPKRAADRRRDLVATFRGGVGVLLRKLLGLLLTACAVSLGAPFWFDLLNKIVNLRASGPAPGSSTKKQKKPNAPVQPPA